MMRIFKLCFVFQYFVCAIKGCQQLYLYKRYIGLGWCFYFCTKPYKIIKIHLYQAISILLSNTMRLVL